MKNSRPTPPLESEAPWLIRSDSTILCHAEREKQQRRAAKAQAKAETAAEDARDATGDSTEAGGEAPE